VIAAARSAEGRRRALSLGASDEVDLSVDDLRGALASAAAPGADLVVDALWGPPASAAIGALKRRGRLVQVGSSAAPAAELVGGPLRGGRIDIRGFSLFSEEREDVARAYAEAAAAALAGELRLRVERVPLTDGPAAWSRLVEGAGGAKLVVVP
jgi:NADPH2:quinone reductase